MVTECALACSTMKGVDYSADLKRAFSALSGKQARLERFFRYYDGEHPSRYLTAKLSAAYQRLDIHFSQNWCAPVVDLLTDRLNLTGIRGPAQHAEAISRLWASEQLYLAGDDVSSDVAISGESYVIVWPDASGVRIFHNDPRLVAASWDAADPRRLTMAAKWWKGDDERRHLTLYYPDAFAHFVSRGKADDLSDERGLVPDGEPEPNETGVVPVFPFLTRRRNPYGELQNAIPPQIAINRLADDMMVASEYSAFKQRWMISNADPADMKSSPGTMMQIPPANTQDGDQSVSVGEFSATELANYVGAIEHVANVMAAVTRTPKPAFFQQGGNVSGDALIAMEAELSHKARAYRERLSVGWREVMAFALQLGGAGVDPADLEPQWDEVRTVQPIAEAQALQALVAAGLPLRSALRRQGWTDDDIEALDEDLATEQAGRASVADAAMAAARLRFDQGADAAPYPQAAP